MDGSEIIVKKTGILGGTFNPPHIAHSIVAECVREQLNLDKILFIPSGNPPLKESIPAEHRLNMARLAFGNYEKFEVSDIEMLNINVRSYTVDTLKKLHEIHRNDSVKFYLIIGVDNLIELSKWKEPEKLFKISEVIVINRPGFEVNENTRFASQVKFITVPYLEISSSMIRENVSKGMSIKFFVCEEVKNYIEINNLYK
ncbi:MAG: nicotinate-nucleotide adenylyltransferase [Ignavibacteria bacterium]